MKKGVNLSKISFYRNELMGFSTLLILICHAGGYIHMSSILAYIVSVGNIGVDMFLFLSGMGLWYSLSESDGGRKAWYSFI